MLRHTQDSGTRNYAVAQISARLAAKKRVSRLQVKYVKYRCDFTPITTKKNRRSMLDAPTLKLQRKRTRSHFRSDSLYYRSHQYHKA